MVEGADDRQRQLVESILPWQERRCRGPRVDLVCKLLRHNFIRNCPSIASCTAQSHYPPIVFYFYRYVGNEEAAQQGRLSESVDCACTKKPVGFPTAAAETEPTAGTKAVLFPQEARPLSSQRTTKNDISG